MKKSKELSFSEKVFVVLILLSSCTTIVSDFGIIRYILVFVYIVMVFGGKIKITNRHKQITILAGGLGLWLTQLLWFGNLRNITYLFKVFIILAMMITYANADLQKNLARIDYFVKILFYVSIGSSIVYFLFLLGVGLPQFTSSLGLPCYFYLLQEFYDPVFGILSYRNNGIFWEPGVNQVFMNFLLFYTLFDKRRFGKAADRLRAFFKCTYIVITIITTGSVMGYMLCAAIIVLKGISGIKKPQNALMSVMTLTSILIAVPFVMALFSSKQETMSYEYRLGDLRIGITQFLQHPIIGKGIGDDSYQAAFANVYGIARSNSNGILRLILATGSIGAVFYALSAYKFVVWIEASYFEKSKMALSVWIILSQMNEPIESCALMSFLIGVGWHSKPIIGAKKKPCNKEVILIETEKKRI